ncbi:unnamed protein product [Brassica oleracea]
MILILSFSLWNLSFSTCFLINMYTIFFLCTLMCPGLHLD